MLSEYDRNFCKQVIAKDGWQEYGLLGNDIPFNYTGREVYVLYENREGRLSICVALCVTDIEDKNLYTMLLARDGDYASSIIPIIPRDKCFAYKLIPRLVRGEEE